MTGFIGLSHLGLNYSLATAAKGFDVVAFDPDAALAARCSKGDFPIEEPGFRELYAAHRNRIAYTSEAGRLAACDLVFYALDIRTNERNESDTAPLTQLILGTIGSLAPDATVVLLSQVSPGYTRKLIEDLGQRGLLSRRQVFYQVETLIFGAAVQRAMEPERYIVGAGETVQGTRNTDSLPDAFQRWHAAFKCPVLVMRFESAELAKIAINFFLVSTVATTNTLAEVCEAIGADWSEIAPALRLDKRIGPHAYLKPGLGIAGGNLERDLVTVQRMAERHGTEAGIVSAWQANSAHRRDWVLRALHRELLGSQRNPVVAIWGLAYKIDTHSLKNSPSVELLRSLKGVRIRAHDPVAVLPPGEFPEVTVVATPLEALDGADALVIMTPWKIYSGIAARSIAEHLRGQLVFDPLGALPAADCAGQGLRVLTLGRSPD